MVWQRTQAALPARLAAGKGGGCGARLMKSQALRCRPRQCWMWRVCTGVIHKVIHAGCGVCGPHVGPLHGHWSIRRQRVAGRAGIGFARHAQAFSTGSSTVAVDWFGRRCVAGAKGMARSRAGLRRTGQALRYPRRADEFAGTALQAAPVLDLACMPSACPQGHPRRLWTVHVDAGHPHTRPLGALMKSQAPRCSPRRHWLCAVSISVFHRVIHGGCGLTVPVSAVHRPVAGIGALVGARRATPLPAAPARCGPGTSGWWPPLRLAWRPPRRRQGLQGRRVPHAA